jgi:hypothetical protein
MVDGIKHFEMSSAYVLTLECETSFRARRNQQTVCLIFTVVDSDGTSVCVVTANVDRVSKVQLISLKMNHNRVRDMNSSCYKKKSLRCGYQCGDICFEIH